MFFFQFYSQPFFLFTFIILLINLLFVLWFDWLLVLCGIILLFFFFEPSLCQYFFQTLLVLVHLVHLSSLLLTSFRNLYLSPSCFTFSNLFMPIFFIKHDFMKWYLACESFIISYSLSHNKHLHITSF